MNMNKKQGYLHDILSQPEALDATHQALESSFNLGNIPARLKAGEFKHILLTGMGSSHFIFYPLYYELVKQPTPVTIIESSELIHFTADLIKKDSLIITASQSGSSAETLRLLEMSNKTGATVLGITNTATSPLATKANVCLLTHAGPEATVSCKTYVAALLALRWLQDGLFDRDLSASLQETAQAGKLVQSYLQNWQEHVDFLKLELAGKNNFFMTGRGPSLAAVLTGSLTVKESTLLHGEGLSCAALRHGPMEMMREGTYVMVFAGSKKTQALNMNLTKEMNAQGAHAVWVSADTEVSAAYRLPKGPKGLLPIFEILPTEIFNLALADLHNHTAGVFEHATKVTSKE